MGHEERRGLVERYLDELRTQREVDLREALAEVIHLVFELEQDIKGLSARVSNLEDSLGDRR